MSGAMKTVPWPLMLGIAMLLSAPAGSQPIPWQASAEEKAVAAAEAWLALVDQGKHAESWEQAATYFRRAVSRASWEETLNAFRKPLGNLLERKRTSARFTTTLPGAPDGRYVVVQFQTSFQNKKSAVETVTPMLDENGVWRVSGYYIQ